MSTPDAVFVTLMMFTDFSEFRIIPDRSQQGVVCKIVTIRALLTSMANDPIFNFGGISIIDPTSASYFGNSQGGILGGTLMAAHTEITRGVLGVPGAPYSLLLPRSVDFDSYSIPIRLRYLDSLDRMFLICVIQMVWDRGEPSGYMHLMSNFPNAPVHNVLFHYANHDSEVTWLGAYFQARSCDAVMFDGNVSEYNETIFGFDRVPAGGSIFNRNMIQGYDYQRPPAPKENIPPPGELNTHGRPRQEQTAWDQMDLFFRTGEVHDFCNGPCNRDP